jgi:hypothetical protein
MTARAVFTVCSATAVRLRVFPGEVAVAACVSAIELALLKVIVLSVEESATALDMLFPEFANPETFHIVPARALLAPGEMRAEVPAAGAPGVVCPTQIKE